MDEPNRPPLLFSITDTIKDIPKTDWEELFEDVIEGYGYQKTLEEARLKEFSFGYLVGKRNNNFNAIFPFFIMDFYFETLIQGPLHCIIKRLRSFLGMRVLFLGSPTSEEFYLGISKEENLTWVLDKALEELLKICKKNKISGITFYNLSEKNTTLGKYLSEKGFFKMESLPGTLLKINADSLEGYINSLSKNTRKDLRKKLKRSSSEVKLTTEIREDVSDISQDIYKLYLNNFNGSDVHFEVLTLDFFKNICRNMPGVAKYFITRDREKIVSFNLCLTKGDLCIDKFVGFEPAVSHKYHLYYTTFCHNIDWCIKNGFRFYQPGATDYHPKLRLGAKLIPLFIYAKALNPVLNSFLKLIAKFIEPKNLDDDLRDYRKFNWVG